MGASESERFWAKVDKRGCWVWTAYRNVFGYGMFRPSGPQRVAPVLVHRWAYEHLVGPIPKDMQVDHRCRNRACVRPEHLELVTAQENQRRGTSPAAVNARKTHCHRNHEFTSDNTRWYRGGRVCRRCHADKQSQRARKARAERQSQ